MSDKRYESSTGDGMEKDRKGKAEEAEEERRWGGWGLGTDVENC